MADAALGEIRMWASTAYVPFCWSLCDGSLLNIQEYQELYSLIGVTYGGDGKTTFGLPDLRGRVPVGQGKAASGTTYTLGQSGGAETVTLTESNMPMHTHTFNAVNAAADGLEPANQMLGTVTPNGNTKGLYVPVPTATAGKNTPLNDCAVGFAYGSSGSGVQPHINLMPSFGMNFIICVRGLYPQRS